MPKSLLLSLLLAVLAAPSCKPSESAVATGNGSAADSPDSAPSASSLEDWPADELLLFKMSRRPCMGACKVYSLRIWQDGTVRYEGSRHVERLGRWRVHIEKDALGSILKEAQEIGYFSFEEEYPTGGIRIMDLPSTVSTLYVDGKSHQIINRNYANPDVEGESARLEQLRQFESYVDKVVEEGVWTQILEQQSNE